MKTISNREFCANPDLYLGVAKEQDVRIRRGRGMFTLVYTPPADEQPLRAPDDKLRSAITFDELLVGVKEDLREIFAGGKRAAK